MECRNQTRLETVFDRQDAEELANSTTHAFGLVLSVAGGVALLVAAAQRSDPFLLVGCGVYSATLVALYSASTLSHVFHRSAKRRLLRRLDQGCIYLLIAGSFTPFALAYLTEGAWPLLLAAMWITATVGFFSKVVRAHRVDSVSTWIYLLLGWMPATALKPILEQVPAACLGWILAGGLCYTIGTLFLTFDRKIPYFHAIWHLFVIAGSACHYVVIVRYVVQ